MTVSQKINCQWFSKGDIHLAHIDPLLNPPHPLTLYWKTFVIWCISICYYFRFHFLYWKFWTGYAFPIGTVFPRKRCFTQPPQNSITSQNFLWANALDLWTSISIHELSQYSTPNNYGWFTGIGDSCGKFVAWK